MNNLSFLFAAKTLNEESIKLLDGDLTLYKRPTSHQWQCRFKLATGAWHSASTGSDQIAEATTQAIAIYETVKIKIASDLAIKTRTFRQLANQELAAAARVVHANPNKRTHVDYIHIYTKYLIPFFGAYQINDITQEVVDDYVAWRISQMGKEHKAALADLILHRAGGYNLNDPDVPADLRSFIQGLKRERMEAR